MTAPALDVPLFGHSDEVVRLVARFEDGTLPKAEWTHQAHLAVALWYASRLPFEEALVAMREGIQTVNAAHGVATTPTGGYHETITRFYMRVICGYVTEEEGEAARGLPLRHYTKDLLMSAGARFDWVEPDLRPIA